MIYALVALVAVLAAYFLFFKKSEPAQLAPPATNKEPAARAKSGTAASPAAEGDEVAPASASGPVKSGARAAPEAPSSSGAARPSQPPGSAARPAPPSRRSAARAPRDIEGLRRGLSKARAEEGFFGRLRALFAGKKEISADVMSELEEVLLSSDVGTETTALLLNRVKEVLSQSELADPERQKLFDQYFAESIAVPRRI